MDYFRWLCELVCAEGMDHSYLILCRKLFDQPFEVKLEMDQNRVGDAKTLRQEYAKDASEEDLSDVISMQDREHANCFELLVALARRMAYEIDDLSGSDMVPGCFWEMVENLGLGNFSDEEYSQTWFEQMADDILKKWVGRKYKADGRGGLFPLKAPTGDQRKVEIWYQMMGYLMENY